jgi:hypothetical protein
MISKGRIRAAKQNIESLIKRSSAEHMGAKGQQEIAAAFSEHRRLVKKRLKQLKEETTGKRGF